MLGACEFDKAAGVYNVAKACRSVSEKEKSAISKEFSASHSAIMAQRTPKLRI